ncbi:hypothetical protein [Clavibacter nebraskensis]|uniref:hypothetical protein n=1 Tax=Clavibacter nebraskensis TaxID=31963 RepID=UPI003F4B2E88
MSNPPSSPRVARFYTSARRIPILIGKMPNGGRILGGPYSILQLVTLGFVFFTGWYTRGLWGPSMSPLLQILTLVMVSGASTLAAGRIPSTKRKLPDLAMDAMAAVTAPFSGSYQGRPLRLAPPHIAGGAVLLALDPSEVNATPARQDVAVSRTSELLPLETNAPALVSVTSDAAAPSPSAVEALPDNVIPLVPRTNYGTGLERLLDQARRKDTP